MIGNYGKLVAIVCAGMLLWGCSDDAKGDSGNGGTDGGTDTGVGIDTAGGTDSLQTGSDSMTSGGDSASGGTGGDTGVDSGSNDTTSSSADSAVCGKANVDFSSQIPTVLLLIDQSGSMDDAGFPTDDDPFRWDVVEDALINPDTGLVAQLEADVRFGLSLYTSHGGGVVPDACPVLTNVAPALNNYESIAAPYAAAGPDRDTPTAESIDAAAATLAAITEPGPKVIVLATDGDPDNCADPDAHNATSQELAETAVRNAFEQHNVFTFVISVGSDTTPAHMQAMANAGQGVAPGEADTQWWLANDSQGLEDAFNTIVNGVRSCVMDLDGEMVAGKEVSCEVKYTAGGAETQLSMDDANGWRVNSPTQIELVGSACDAIKTGDVTASVACPCDAFIISVE